MQYIRDYLQEESKDKRNEEFLFDDWTEYFNDVQL